MRGLPEATQAAARADHIFVPCIVLAELRVGFLGGSKAAENERNLIRFLSRPRVEALFEDDDTTHHCVRLFHQLRLQGTPIPTNDIWIGALAVRHDLHLLAPRAAIGDYVEHNPLVGPLRGLYSTYSEYNPRTCEVRHVIAR